MFTTCFEMIKTSYKSGQAYCRFTPSYNTDTQCKQRAVKIAHNWISKKLATHDRNQTAAIFRPCVMVYSHL